jgi:hypothetical protein
LTQLLQRWTRSGEKTILTAPPLNTSGFWQTTASQKEEDVQWQLLPQHEMEDLPDEDREDAEVIEFVENEAAAVEFLVKLLRKYQSSSVRYRSEPSVT